VPVPEILHSYVNVSQAFSKIIRDRLQDGEMMHVELGNIPDYLLVCLDPFWEEIVEKALFLSPLLSARVRKLAYAEHERRADDGGHDGDDPINQDSFHDSPALLRVLVMVGAFIVGPGEGSFKFAGSGGRGVRP
jgi:hypothetical protein